MRGSTRRSIPILAILPVVLLAGAPTLGSPPEQQSVPSHGRLVRLPPTGRISTRPPAHGPALIAGPQPETAGEQGPRVDTDSHPWWQEAALRPMRKSAGGFSVDVNSLILDALRHSPHVRAISDNPAIAQTAIVEAAAEFDTTGFMETKFVRTSVPTGSVLDAGYDVPRLRDEDWFYDLGLRRKNQLGGEFEIAQRFGLQDSNSLYFFPEQQGNSRLTLSYTQPLLNGAGRAYNTSLIVLANIDTRAAADRTAAKLEEHLLEVTGAFWEMYLQRVTQLQKAQHLQRAEVILHRLEQRRDVDALDSQIARARAAVSMRRAELIRAAAGIRNAEVRVRSLVNSPAMLSDRQAELVPAQAPQREYIPVDLSDALVTALHNRPEIDAAAQEIKSACVRCNMAEKELLPVLDIVLETYVSGLRGDYDIGRSLADQFSEGEPSYTAGLVFEVPLHNRAAKARYRRRWLEHQQMTARFQAVVETLHAEVEIAVRDVETGYRHLQAKRVSMVAAEADVRYLQRRWELLPGDDRAASFLLEDLLDAQDRLAFEEAGLAQAQVDYARSLLQLKQATGTLLRRDALPPPAPTARRLPDTAVGTSEPAG